MGVSIKTTKVTTVNRAGDWGGAITLTELEGFIKDAREAGFTDRDKILVGENILLRIRMTKTEVDTETDWS